MKYLLALVTLILIVILEYRLGWRNVTAADNEGFMPITVTEKRAGDDCYYNNKEGNMFVVTDKDEYAKFNKILGLDEKEQLPKFDPNCYHVFIFAGQRGGLDQNDFKISFVTAYRKELQGDFKPDGAFNVAYIATRSVLLLEQPSKGRDYVITGSPWLYCQIDKKKVDVKDKELFWRHESFKMLHYKHSALPAKEIFEMLHPSWNREEGAK